MKTIELTRGLVALVDDSDFDDVNRFNWQAVPGRKTFYAQRNVVIAGKHTTIAMHRQLCGSDSTGEIDHWNGCGLDNRRSNLRASTTTQNRGNSQRQVDNKSGFKGVHWDKSQKKFRAQIGVKGKILCGGRFSSAEDAAHSYDELAKKHFGEFARLNFP